MSFLDRFDDEHEATRGGREDARRGRIQDRDYYDIYASPWDDDPRPAAYTEAYDRERRRVRREEEGGEW